MAAASKLEANELGSLFVNQYYNILEKRPDEMHKFYVSNARFSFKDSSNKDSDVECTGNMKIQDGLKSIGVSSVSGIAASSLQCGDESGPKEIMVMVSGLINLNGQETPRLFAQSFFISEAMEGVMFIVAESLHILSSAAQSEETDELPNTKASTELSSEPEKVEAVEEVPVERSEPVVQPVFAAPVQSAPQEAPAVTEPVPASSQPTEKAKPKQQQQQQAQAAKEKTPAQAWGPNSKNAKIMSSIAPLSQQPTKSDEKSSATQAESSASSTAPAKQQQQQSGSSSSGNHGQRLSKEQVERSVYIKDLPAETTKDEIQEVFSKFGKISFVDLRQEKRCVYVEYFDPVSAKAALVKPATPILLAGKPIEVKERLMVQQGEGNNNNSNANNNSSRGAKGAAKPKPSGGAANSNNGNSKNIPKQSAKPKENGTAKSEESKPAAKATATANGSEDKQKGAASASKTNSAANESKPKQQPKQNQNQSKPAGKPKST